MGSAGASWSQFEWKRLPGEPEEGNVTLSVPNILHLPARYPIQSILDEIQREETPEHLRPWLKVQNQENTDGLGHGRFGTIFQIAFFRDTVLASRYRDRFTGHVEPLDVAFAAYLNLSLDSIKKIRLQANRLRSNRS